MSPLLLLPHAVARSFRAPALWLADQQAHARRNAMLANTALAARRAEREDVEHYLRQRHTLPERPGRSGRPGPPEQPGHPSGPALPRPRRPAAGGER